MQDIKIKPWEELKQIHKEKFKNESDYLSFFRDVVLHDTSTREKYTSQTKDRVIEGVTWAKEFSKFHQRYKDGYSYKFSENNTILNIGHQTTYLIKPQFAAYHAVRKIMRNWLIKRLKDEYVKKKPAIYNPPKSLNQGESNFITRRTKVAYLVYMGDLAVRDNLLYSIRDNKTLVPKPASLSWCVSQFDDKYISDGILTYPKNLGPLNENLLSGSLSF